VTHHDPHALIKMAEQIARNIPDRGHVAKATGEHIKTFWAPSMITTLTDYSHKHPEEVSADVRGALAQLSH
jgi:Tfp pilus assembly protein PilW